MAGELYGLRNLAVNTRRILYTGKLCLGKRVL